MHKTCVPPEGQCIPHYESLPKGLSQLIERATEVAQDCDLKL